MKRDFRLSPSKDETLRTRPPEKLKLIPTHEEPAPKPPRNKYLIHAIVIIIGSGLLFFSAIILTPTLGKVTGYANAQPPLEIIRPTGTGADYDSDRVLRLMRALCAQRPGIEKDFWPIPAKIEEKADCWQVTFAAKIPVYSFLGFQHTVEPSTPNMYVTVNKADYTVSFGKWCQ
jgi:hypothetical protein